MSDDGQVCCLIGVCCPSGSVEQREALRDAMAADINGSDYGPGHAADWILDHFDLAPKGSMVKLTELFRAAAKRGKL